MLLNSRNQLGTLWRELSQAQDEFERWFGRKTAAVADPMVNIWEDDNSVFAEVELPGVDPAKLEITVSEGNQLTIQGERVPPAIDGVSWIRQERPFGKFNRVIQLPTLVNAENVNAKYENGILKLTLPKHEAAKPRKIAVKGE
jgi:HSP20 family protein